MIRHVFHEPPPLGVVGLKNRILQTIEFKGRHVVSVTQFPIKGRGCLYPLSFQIKFGESMKYKEVCPDIFNELPGRQMVDHIGKTYSRRDMACPAEGTEERSFTHAVASLAHQHIAGAIVFREVKGIIRIVPDAISHGVIKFDSLFDLIGGFLANSVYGVRLQSGDDRCRSWG